MIRRSLLMVLMIGLLSSCSQAKDAKGSFANVEKVDYAQLKTEISEKHADFIQRYKAGNADQKKALIGSARKYLLTTVDEKIFPAWMGTTWDFNGTTQVPRKGMIACGYFVTTVMRDAGFKIQRVKLAQQASLIIIRTICPKAEIRDYGNVTVPQVCQKLAAMPEGLYIVGLDIHTGFIYNRRGDIEFIHASYGNPAVVVREKALQSAVLAQSNRFVFGRVDNDFFLKKWLGGVEVNMSK